MQCQQQAWATRCELQNDSAATRIAAVAPRIPSRHAVTSRWHKCGGVFKFCGAMLLRAPSSSVQVSQDDLIITTGNHPTGWHF
jgi:hypothetical protein